MPISRRNNAYLRVSGSVPPCFTSPTDFPGPPDWKQSVQSAKGRPWRSWPLGYAYATNSNSSLKRSGAFNLRPYSHVDKLPPFSFFAHSSTLCCCNTLCCKVLRRCTGTNSTVKPEFRWSKEMLQASCLQQLYCCTENRLAEKSAILKQPERGCSQSKPIIKSADLKDNVIKTSAKSQDTSKITWRLVTTRWKPKYLKFTWWFWKHLKSANHQTITQAVTNWNTWKKWEFPSHMTIYGYK